jgi:tetratricopeptide (TPR) repeat protein
MGRIRLFKAMVFGGVSGGAAGLLGGILAGHPVLGFLAGSLLVGFGSFFVSEVIGNKAKAIYSPSGASTPPNRDYSRAEALAVRGHYDDAIAVYEVAIAELPSDPDPYVRLATLLMEKVGDPERASVWLQRALKEGDLRGKWEIVLVRELTDLYVHRMVTPARAAPLLARVADRYEGTADGDWAREELAHVKRLMAADME